MTQVVQKTLTIPTDSKYLEELRRFVGATLEATTLDERTRSHLTLALDEAVSSILDYALDAGYDSEITVSIDVDDVRFRAVVADSRTDFDGSNRRAKVTRSGTLYSKERRHKLRIFLLQRLLDEIHYLFQRGFENKLELLKFV
jgi:anti-sigma regulatory factor (Ser/Thr protein kinase)